MLFDRIMIVPLQPNFVLGKLLHYNLGLWNGATNRFVRENLSSVNIKFVFDNHIFTQNGYVFHPHLKYILLEYIKIYGYNFVF